MKREREPLWHLPEVTKQRMSEAKKGRSPFAGHHHTPTTRKRIQRSMLRRWMTAEHREKVIAGRQRAFEKAEAEGR